MRTRGWIDESPSGSQARSYKFDIDWDCLHILACRPWYVNNLSQCQNYTCAPEGDSSACHRPVDTRTQLLSERNSLGLTTLKYVFLLANKIPLKGRFWQIWHEFFYIRKKRVRCECLVWLWHLLTLALVTTKSSWAGSTLNNKVLRDWIWRNFAIEIT